MDSPEGHRDAGLTAKAKQLLEEPVYVSAVKARAKITPVNSVKSEA